LGGGGPEGLVVGGWTGGEVVVAEGALGLVEDEVWVVVDDDAGVVVVVVVAEALPLFPPFPLAPPVVGGGLPSKTKEQARTKSEAASNQY